MSMFSANTTRSLNIMYIYFIRPLAQFTYIIGRGHIIKFIYKLILEINIRTQAAAIAHYT